MVVDEEATLTAPVNGSNGADNGSTKLTPASVVLPLRWKSVESHPANSPIRPVLELFKEDSCAGESWCLLVKRAPS